MSHRIPQQRYFLEFSFEGLVALWGMARVSAIVINGPSPDEWPTGIRKSIDEIFDCLETLHGTEDAGDREMASKISKATDGAGKVIHEAMVKAATDRGLPLPSEEL